MHTVTLKCTRCIHTSIIQTNVCKTLLLYAYFVRHRYTHSLTHSHTHIPIFFTSCKTNFLLTTKKFTNYSIARSLTHVHINSLTHTLTYSLTRTRTQVSWRLIRFALATLHSRRLRTASQGTTLVTSWWKLVTLSTPESLTHLGMLWLPSPPPPQKKKKKKTNFFLVFHEKSIVGEILGILPLSCMHNNMVHLCICSVYT